MLCIVMELRNTTKTMAFVFTLHAYRISIGIMIREVFTRHIFSGLGLRSRSGIAIMCLHGTINRPFSYSTNEPGSSVIFIQFYARGSIEWRDSFHYNCGHSRILQNVANYSSILILFRIAKRSIADRECDLDHDPILLLRVNGVLGGLLKLLQTGHEQVSHALVPGYGGRDFFCTLLVDHFGLKLVLI